MLRSTLACLVVTAITMAACSVLLPEPANPDACHVDLPIGHPKQGASC